MRIYFSGLALFLLCGAVLGNGKESEDVVLAIISSEKERNVADMLLADLSGRSGLAFVERDEMDRIREELEMRDWSFSSGIDRSQFAGADVLVLLRRPVAKAPPLLRLISTHTGGVLGATEIPEKVSPEWSELTAEWIAKHCRLDRVEGVPLVMMQLQSARGDSANELLVSAKLGRELYFRPEIAVLERWRLRDAVFEKLLKDSGENFDRAGWILEGRIFDQTDPMVVEIVLRQAGTDSPVLEKKFEIDEAGRVFNKIAVEISAGLNVSEGEIEESINDRGEVSEQLDRGKWAMEWGDYDQAIRSFENGIALAPRTYATFEAYLAAAYFKRGSWQTVIHSGVNDADTFQSGLLDLCMAFALLRNATDDPLEFGPRVHGLACDMLIGLNRPLTSGAALETDIAEVRRSLAELRRNARQVYRKLLIVEDLDPRYFKQLVEVDWISGSPVGHEYFTSVMAGLTSGGLWEETREDAIETLIEASKRLERMPEEGQAAVFEASVGARGFDLSWIGRWPGGFDLPGDMELWSDEASGEGGLVEMIPALAAVWAATSVQGSPFSKNDPNAWESAARDLAAVIRDEMENLLDQENPELLAPISEVIESSWRVSVSSESYAGAREALESAWLAANEEVLDSGDDVHYMVYNLFNRPEMVPLRERKQLEARVRDLLDSAEGGERFALERMLEGLASVQPPPPSQGLPSSGFASWRPRLEVREPIREESENPRQNITHSADFGFSLSPGPETKIIGEGREPSRWLFRARADELRHPTVEHRIVYGGGRMWIAWAYPGRLVVEHFDLDGDSSTLWYPPSPRDEVHFGVNLAVLGGNLFIYSQRSLLWTPLEKEDWHLWKFEPGFLQQMKLSGGELYVVGGDSIQRIDPESESLSIIWSERLGIEEADAPGANGLKFIAFPKEGTRAPTYELQIKSSEDRQDIWQMAKQGELRTNFDPAAAFWAIYQMRGPQIPPDRFNRWSYGSAIEGLSPMDEESVIAAGADSEAIWLLYGGGGREDQRYFLGMVPWDRREPARELPIQMPEFSDTLLVAPDAVLVFYQESLPVAVYSKVDWESGN
ncbi:hypothetical protein [Puniceicoccus vermicola]|uniref:Tetratricopeptide repeat protein n=1 Tax=Puniceicoccus vermicola TaxID=388746 RepID=A0A7X1B2B2_9BACT|nr:hypothetical protein [Puniceicoccus vermicola]MBC2603268.1 hypothetical protein [Puniceicoccus vermicola]